MESSQEIVAANYKQNFTQHSSLRVGQDQLEILDVGKSPETQ